MNLLSILLLLLLLCTCSADRAGEFCNADSEISGNSQIFANIDRLLPVLVFRTALTGFATVTYGKGQDKVHGLAQCRGDVSSKDCFSCIQDAAKQIREVCPDQADARIWFEYCFLRYDNINFIGKVDTDFSTVCFNLAALTDQIRAEAVFPGNRGLGKGEKKLSRFVKLYALVQCIRDLSRIDCAQCLAIAIGSFPDFCDDRKGCRIFYSICYVRYELYPFFFPIDSRNSLVNTSMVVANP
uniref:Gnk2-homologous domain-containing protein n=1 Tax=Populus trichocarpa TaxID=3694 RepID=U5GRB0_POPTR